MNSDPRLQTIEDYINTDQQCICESGANYILLEGVAGSRKTDTLVRLGLRRHLREKKNILFLTQVGSVTDEICSRVSRFLRSPIYRQGSSNHHIALSHGKTIEVANFDAWVHRQLQDQEWKHLKTMGAYHTFKAKALLPLDNFRGFCLKNGEYADEILVDECQDFDPTKAQLIVSLLKKVPDVRAVFCGDYMQTIFERSLEGSHPFTIFSGLEGCKKLYMQKCYRCPAGHLLFCNKILHEAMNRYKCKPLESTNSDVNNKPFLFTHGSTTKKYDIYVLVGQLCKMVEVLLEHDKSLEPQDFCFMMRKSNNQPVFDSLRVSLEKLWASRGRVNSVIHFMTQYDGYRNPIQWEHATNKSCLISIHGDKGKGHKVVFFLGLTQKSIPDECAMHKEHELLYHSLLNVALTRSTQYLMVGFHYAQPSVYLTQVPLEKYAHVSWSEKNIGLYQHLASCNRFPKPDLIQSYRKLPLEVPTLNMLSIVDISRRFERPEDIFGFNPKTEITKFGKRVRSLRISEHAYPILSTMCELFVMKELQPTLFLKDIEWFPQHVFFTDDERLLSWAHDFRLFHWTIYHQQLALLRNTHQSIIDHDPTLQKAMETLAKSPTYIMHSCFNHPRFHKSMSAFMTNQETAQEWWDIALLFFSHQKELSPGLDAPCHLFPSLFENIRSFLRGLSTRIIFRPCHDMLATISDPKDLEELGFEQELDNHYFENGYYYGILGTSGLWDAENKILYNMKVSPIDFSMEWIMQTSFHANIPTKKTQHPPEKMVVVNFLTGKTHSWRNTFPHPRSLLKKLMTIYSFPEPLSDNLYRMNHRRFKHY